MNRTAHCRLSVDKTPHCRKMIQSMKKPKHKKRYRKRSYLIEPMQERVLG